MLKIIQNRKYFYLFSGILVIGSWILLATWGLKYGLDFTGGALLEIEFQKTERPTASDIQSKLEGLNLGKIVIQPVEDNSMILRFKEINEEQHQALIKVLEDNYTKKIEQPVSNGEDKTVTIEPNNKKTSKDAVATATVATVTLTQGKIVERRFDSIGPSVGKEIKSKAVTSVVIASLAIILYVAWSFRKVSKPVSSWKYGVAAVVALIHDISITAGIFVLLGRYNNVEIGASFVAAILTILGYSVNDTIVVFDRIRENLLKTHEGFEETVNRSVIETITRSINTSLTTFLALTAVFFFGGESIKDFALALMIGIVFGTYSSIFLASPLVVSWENWRRKQ